MSETGDQIRVLHVDDEPDFAGLAATFLEREDDRFAVESETSASDGLERLAAESFDCVVSDYDMPGRNGIEFLEAVRAEHPDVPFVLFTGKGSEAVASEAISAGVTEYLQKESGTSQYTVLANRIRNAVEKHHAQRELADRERRLNLFFEQSPLGVIEWDEQFDCVRLNESAEEILGYEESELVGRPWETIVPASDQPAVDDVVSALLEDEGGYHSVNENVRADGERVVCEWHNWVVTDEGDEVEAIFSQFRDITDRRQRERRFQAVFHNTFTFAGLLSPDGTVLEANERALSFGGLDRADVVGKPMWETEWFQADESVGATARRAVERASEGELFRDEIRIQGADREAVIDFTVRPVTDERDEVTLLVPEGRDITEREAQERKRQQIIDRVTDAIVEVNSDWEFTLVNDQAEDLYDMTEADLLGRDFWSVFGGAVGTRFESEYREVMESREPTSFVEYYDGLDGWFDVEVYPEDDGGIAFYFIEVTERRERQRELERQHERFRYVEGVADIGYWEIDTRTAQPHDVTASRGVYRIHDLPPDEPFDVEKGLEFYHPDDRRQVREVVERAIEDAQPYDFEARIVTATGSQRWVHSVGEPVECDGAVVSVRGVFQDVTERKRQERQLVRHNERLNEFASIVSHDLQNPLSVAAGRLELALRTNEDESEHVTQAASAIERSQELVDDLLVLARQGETLGTVESVDLTELVENCWRNVATEECTLVTETGRAIRADPSRLAQLFENLIRNAVEHGSDEGTVTVGETDRGFYVADDGPGIPAAEREQVFESGYTSDEGTGIGLAIVESVADAHDWTVSVTESAAGGARFEFNGVEFV